MFMAELFSVRSRDARVLDESRVMTLREDEPAALTWVADVPLLTNPVILKAMVLMFAFTWLLLLLIAVGVLGADGHLERLPAFMGAMSIGVGVVLVLMVLIMLILFRNRIRYRFLVTDEGLAMEMADRTAAIAGSLAIAAGVASGKPTLTGAGLGTVSSRREFTPWRRVGGADFVPERHLIRLKPSGWWPVGAIHCTEESFPAVAAKVQAILDRQQAGATSRQPR